MAADGSIPWLARGLAIDLKVTGSGPAGCRLPLPLVPNHVPSGLSLFL